MGRTTDRPRLLPAKMQAPITWSSTAPSTRGPTSPPSMPPRTSRSKQSNPSPPDPTHRRPTVPAWTSPSKLRPMWPQRPRAPAWTRDPMLDPTWAPTARWVEPPDSSTVDASDGSTKDAPADVVTSVPDGSLDDGALGACVSAGTYSGVACGSTFCSSRPRVCCIDHDPVGTATFPPRAPRRAAARPASTAWATEGLLVRVPRPRRLPEGWTGLLRKPGPLRQGSAWSAHRPADNQTFTQFPACENSCECSSGMCKAVLGGNYGEPVNTCGGTCP